MISQMKNDEKPLMLVFPFGLLAHYLRCLVLCRQLRNYYTIRILYHEAYNSFIEDEGFDTFHCAALDPAMAIEGVKDFDLNWLKKDEIEKLFLSQVNVIRESGATVVLGDYTPTLKMAASKTGSRFISVMNGYMSKYFAGTRKISQSHPAYKFIRHLPPGLASFLTKYGESIAFMKLHQPFNAIRKKYGLNTCSSYLDELEGELNLICDLPELFPQKATPENYHVVGPLYYDAGSSPDHPIGLDQ